MSLQLLGIVCEVALEDIMIWLGSVMALFWALVKSERSQCPLGLVLHGIRTRLLSGRV